MTFGSVLRSIAAAERRAARESARRERAAARIRKLQHKLSEIERAAAEAEAYEAQISQLTSIHHSAGDAIDWSEIMHASPPAEQVRRSTSETAAAKRLAEFQPSFFQKLFRKAEAAKAKLEQEVIDARAEDDRRFAKAKAVRAGALKQWEERRAVAIAITSGDIAAYSGAVRDLDPLAEIVEMGCVANLAFPNPAAAEVSLIVESEKVIPRESKSVTRTGKLSTKPIPRTKFNELYQDYVCGSALRVGRELFACLPLKLVVVNVRAPLLDTATGRVANITVLSVAMPRETMEGIVFETADPSDAMRLFRSRMGFKRSEGFFGITELAASEYPLVR
jgi:hypothetical protein